MVDMFYFPTESRVVRKNRTEDGEGVFAKPPAEDADENTDIETVNDPKEALPEGWDILRSVTNSSPAK